MAGVTWQIHRVGSLPKASHAQGPQGAAVADLVRGGRREILLTSSSGVFMFEIPAVDPTQRWRRVQLSQEASDEGVAVGDINRDGHLDVAITTGDLKGVQWLQNPGDADRPWEAHQVGEMPDTVYPDRIAVLDINQDGLLDMIVTEENGQPNGAETFAWIQPIDPAQDWSRRLWVSQGSTNSLGVGDMDGDGDLDVLLAEHRGALGLRIWRNMGHGRYEPFVISAGIESHLGAQPVDLDNDGDLDVVGLAWDAGNEIHIWRNEWRPSAGTDKLTAAEQQSRD